MIGIHTHLVAFIIHSNNYSKTSSISRTKSPNLNASHLVLQLSQPNPLKPGVTQVENEDVVGAAWH